jgi:hypothetical protein
MRREQQRRERREPRVAEQQADEAPEQERAAGIDREVGRAAAGRPQAPERAFEHVADALDRTVEARVAADLAGREPDASLPRRRARDRPRVVHGPEVVGDEPPAERRREQGVLQGDQRHDRQRHHEPEPARRPAERGATRGGTRRIRTARTHEPPPARPPDRRAWSRA